MSDELELSVMGEIKNAVPVDQDKVCQRIIAAMLIEKCIDYADFEITIHKDIFERVRHMMMVRSETEHTITFKLMAYSLDDDKDEDIVTNVHCKQGQEMQELLDFQRSLSKFGDDIIKTKEEVSE